MMVTALSPVLGYDRAAAISYQAIDHDLTLKQAALAKGGARTCSTGLSAPSRCPAAAPPISDSANPPALRPAAHAWPNAGEVEQP